MATDILNLFSLEGRTAIVTGASRGIGWTIALGLLLPSPASANHGWWGWKNGYYRYIGSQKQLFLDDFIVESTRDLTRSTHQATPYPGNPVMKPDQPWETSVGLGRYGSVLYDDEEKTFKMWYMLRDQPMGDGEPPAQVMICYARSRDGVHWEKPHLGQVEFRGTRDNNICFGPPRAPTREEADIDPTLKEAHEKGSRSHLDGPAVLKDRRETDPARRYKMLYRGPPALAHYMVNAAFSPDGVHWTPYPAGINPVIPLRSDTLNNAFWDPSIDRYVALLRMFLSFGADEGRLSSHPDEAGNLMRIVARSESRDFVNWTPAEVIMTPDTTDGLEHGNLHDMEVLPYEGAYLGFLGVWHQGDWLDKADVQLAFSRDGRKWQRAADRKPVLAAENGRAVYLHQAPVIVDDKIWMYYGMCAKRPWAITTVGLAKIRLDGFVSLDAGPAEGIVVTTPFKFDGRQLEVNADAADGHIEVEILEYKNAYHSVEVSPIPGFSRQDCRSIRSDGVRNVVFWRDGCDLSGLRGKTIKLRFSLANAKLYAFQFVKGQLER